MTDIRKKLAQGITEFSYVKKNGKVRHAVGTTNPQILKTESAIPSGRGFSINAETKDWTAYYDMEANGWRSFLTDNLICVKI